MTPFFKFSILRTYLKGSKWNLPQFDEHFKKYIIEAKGVSKEKRKQFIKQRGLLLTLISNSK